MEWKNYLRFNVHTCIDCWGNDCHFPCFIKWHATSYYELFGKFTCFLQPVIFICFIWMSLDKCSSIKTLANVDSWFITEYHFHSSTHHDCFSLVHFNFIFFYLYISAGFHLALLDVNPISFGWFLSFLTNIDSCSNPFVFHLFCYTFSIFKTYCFKFFILMIWCLRWSMSRLSFFNHLII